MNRGDAVPFSAGPISATEKGLREEKNTAKHGVRFGHAIRWEKAGLTMHNDVEHRSTNDALRSIMEDCARAISLLLPRLSGVITDREEDFLQLGSAIFAINTQAGAFASTARETAATVGTGALHATIAELHVQSAEAKSVFSSVSSAEQLRGMSEVMALINTLRQSIEQFGPLVQTLKVLEVTTRIESARLGNVGAGFNTLADDVKSLAKVIAEYHGKISGHAQLLMTQVVAVRDRGACQITARDRVVHGMFQQLFVGIGTLESMRADSVSLIQDLAKDSRAVTESIGQVVASVQFHDITRQQVEHVEEILEHAVGEVASITSETDLSGLAAWMRDVLRLQAPQLRQTQAMFCQAVGDLIGNLENVAQSIDNLQGRIVAIAYADRDGGTRVLDRIRQQISQVMAAMRSTGSQLSEMSKDMGGMAQTIATVGTFVRSIEHIGEEIELIALNARVKANHTGEMGRTLGVIAMEIQQLSVDARSRTGAVSEILSRISALAEHLSALASASDVTKTVEEIQERFEAVLDHLAELDAELGHSVDNLSSLGQDLVARIRALTSSIRFHELVSDQLLGLEGEIKSLEAGYEPYAGLLDTARQPEMLQQQLSRYTMDSERLVHLSVLGHQHAEPSDDGVELFGEDVDVSPESGTGSDDDLGDNVELF